MLRLDVDLERWLISPYTAKKAYNVPNLIWSGLSHSSAQLSIRIYYIKNLQPSEEEQPQAMSRSKLDCQRFSLYALATINQLDRRARALQQINTENYES